MERICPRQMTLRWGVYGMYHGNKGCNRGFGKSSLSQQSPFRAIAFLTPSTVYFALYVDGIGTIDLFSTASLSYNKLHVCAIIRHCCIRSFRSCRRAIQEGTELSAAAYQILEETWQILGT